MKFYLLHFILLLWMEDLVSSENNTNIYKNNNVSNNSLYHSEAFTDEANACDTLTNFSTMTMTIITQHEGSDSIIGPKTELFLLVFEYISSIEYLLCFLANLLTIVAVFRFDYLHKKSTNLLILSLSCADGIVGKSDFNFQFTV